MSAGIVDERVVQMRFDNEQFEKGVSDSMASLKNLNKTIDELPNTSKNGFSKLADSVKGFSLESMALAIDNIESRFSTLGIIGATVIQNLTNTVVNGAKRLVSSAWDGIITGGFNRASNIEQAKFMLKGLGVAWKDIEADINYGVKDTAYSLDSAAKAASQLVASSVELGPSMQAALRGISGVAAMTNSDYDSIAHIFTTIAGQGKVMTMQLRMLETRGLNVAANIAKLFNEMNDGTRDTSDMSEDFVKMVKNYTKGAQITEEAIRKMVSDGKMDFEMFSQAMNEAFGEHSKEANDTFTGVLANIKSALSRIGEAFFQPIIENKGPLVNFLEEIRVKINQANEVIKPFSKLLAGIANNVLQKYGSLISTIDLDEFTKIISNILGAILNFADGIEDVARDIAAGFKVMLPDKGTENRLLKFSEILMSISETFVSATQKSPGNIKAFGAIGKALGALVDIVKQFASAGIESIKRLFEYFKIGDGTISGFVITLSDFIIGVDEAVKESEIFSKIFNGIADAIIFVNEKIRSLIEGIKEILNGSSFVQKLKDKFHELKEEISNIGGDGKEGSDFGQKLLSIGKGAVKILDDIINVISGLFDDFKKVVTNFWDGLKKASGKNNLVELLIPDEKGLKVASGGILLGAAITIRRFVESIINSFRLLTNGEGKQILGIGVNGPFSTLANSLRGLSNSLRKEINVQIIKEVAVAVLELAVAMLILSSIDEKKLAESLGAITLLMGQLVGAFAAITGVLSNGGKDNPTQVITTFGKTFSKTVTSMNNAINMGNAIGMLLAFSTSILILSFAMKNLSSLKWEEIGKGLVGISGAMASLSGAMIVISRFSSQGFSAGQVFGVIAIAVAVKILGGVLYDIGVGMVWEQIGKGLVGLSGVLAILSGAMILISKFAGAKTATSIKSIGGFFTSMKTSFGTLDKAMNIAGILAFAIAIKMLVEPLQAFSKMEWEELEKAGIALGSITIALAAILAVAKGEKASAAALSILIMAKALTSISKSLKDMEGGSLEGTGAILTLMLGLSLMASNIDGNKLLKTAGAMAIFAASLLTMAPAFKLLGSLSIGQLVVSLVAIAGGMAVLVAAAKLLEPVSGSLLALAGSLFLMGTACALCGVGLLAIGAGLGSLGTGLTILVAALPAIIVAIVTGIMAAIKQVSLGIDEVLPLIKDIIVKVVGAFIDSIPQFVTAMLQMINQTLDALKNYLPQIIDKISELIFIVLNRLIEDVPKFMSSITNLIKTFILALSNAFDDLDTNQLLDALKSLGILSAIFVAVSLTGALAGIAAISGAVIVGTLALFAKIFGLIITLPIAESIPIMDQMADVLAKFSEAMALLALFGVAAALSTITGLIPVVVGLTTVLEALGALKQIPGFEWLLNEGSTVLVKLGEVLGEFVGSIISGGLKALSSGLPEIGKNLSEFFISATPFIIGMQTVNGKVLKGVSILTGAILELTAAEVVSGIASFITGGTSFSDMGKELCEFAPYFVKFANTVKDVDGKTVEASANAALSLAKFASAIPNEGGLVAKITGENSLSKFAEELVLFGPSLLAYSMSVKGVDAESVELSAKAALALAQFAQEIPNEGGLVAKITGENSLSKFAEELALFGPSLMAYAISVRGLNTADVESSVNAAKMVSEMANGLPNQGGVSAFFAGDNTLELIAEGLGVFGPAIKKYGEEVSGIQVSSVSASVNAAKMITGLIDSMPNQGGAISWFTGDNTLSKLSAELIIFGENFKTYYETLSNISPEKLSSVTYSVGNLLQSFKGIGDSDSISKFGKVLAELGKDSIAKFVETFTDSSEDVTLAINTMMEYTRSAIDIEAPSVEEKMSQMVGKVINAFTNRYRDGYETCATFITKCLDGLNAHIDEFETAGKNATSGFIEGMKSKLKDVEKIGDTLGKTAKDSTMKSLDEHSPSKVYKVIGTNADLGFVEGMEVGLPEVAKAAEKVGLEAVTALLDITDEGIEELKGLLQNGGENLTDTVSEVGDDIQKVSEEKLNKTFDEISKGAKAMAKSLGTSSNAIEIFAKNYVVNSKGIATSSEALTAASKGIAALSISLIENSNKTKKAGEQTKLTLANMKKAYLEYYDSLKSTIEGQIDVFSAFEKKTDMSMETMLSNIKSQLDGVREWGAMLGSLAGKIDDGLMQALADMGPKGYEYVAALASGTEEQLALYNQYWIESESVATGVTDNLMASMSQNALWVTEGFVKGVNPKAANPVMEEFANNVNSSFKGVLGIASPSQIMYNNGMYVDIGLRNGIVANEALPKKASMEIAERIIDIFEEHLSETKLEDIGKNICEGLKKGINLGVDDVVQAASNLCVNLIESAEGELETHSPSKVFERIGKFIPLGMANGINEYSRYAVQAVNSMSDKAIKGFNTAKEQISSVIDMDIDINPVIRPTLDLSAVRAGASMLGGMFDKTTIAANARGLQNGGDLESNSSNSANITFNQYNNSPKALSRIDIYRQTKNQISQLRSTLG